MNETYTPWSSNISLQGTTPHLYSDGAITSGAYTNSGFNPMQQNNGLLGNMNLGQGLDLFGKGIGALGGLWGMYNQSRGLDAALQQMKNQARTSNYNMQNNTNFHNRNQQAMGNTPYMTNKFAQE